MALAGLTGVSTGAFAHGPRESSAPNSRSIKLTCATFFDYISQTFGELGFADGYKAAMKNHGPSVRREADLVDDAGDTYFLYRRTGRFWGSAVHTTKYDPQGDPRWFMEVIGQDVAFVWGFYWDGLLQLQLPTPETWRKKVAVINRALVARGYEPIPIGFHPNLHTDAVTKKTDLRVYFKRFVENAEIPLAPHGIPYLHDASFHKGSVVIEDRFLDKARVRADYFSQAADHLKHLAEGEIDAKRAAAWRALSQHVRDRAVLIVDNGTGLVSPILTEVQKHLGKGEDPAEQMLHVYHFLLGRYGVSDSSELLSAMINYLKDRPKYKNPLETADLMVAVQDFEAKVFRSYFDDYDPHARLEITLEEFCQSISRRRQELHEVSLELARNHPRAPLDQMIERENEQLEAESELRAPSPTDERWDTLRRWKDRLFFWR